MNIYWGNELKKIKIDERFTDYIIKNENSVKIKLDEKIMYDHFTSNLKIEDKFIEKRIQFIKQLIEQRKLKIEFQMIDTDKNLARKSINAKELKTKNE